MGRGLVTSPFLVILELVDFHQDLSSFYISITILRRLCVAKLRYTEQGFL